MYNLMVSSNEDHWNGDPFCLPRSRCVSVSEYTDAEVVAQFGELNAGQVSVLRSLPCVFAYEKDCAKNPKFGVLRSVKSRGQHDVCIEYSVLPCEPFATAEDLKSVAHLLGIQKFELNRTHWAVKDVDLGRVLAPKGVALPVFALPDLRSGPRGVDIDRHWFEVALSFPGEQRNYVERVAEELDRELGEGACFYDKFYESQLARPNMDVLLQEIYGEKRSGLVVVFVCAEYDEKLWCGIEWRRIRERGAMRDDSEIMYVRVGEGNVDGMTPLDGYLDVRKRAPKEVAQMIVKRTMRQKPKEPLA